MAIFLFLGRENLGQFLDGRFRIHHPAGVIGGIDNDPFGVRRYRLFKSVEVNLEILGLCRDYHQLGTGGLYKAAIFREERSQRNELVPVFCQCLETDGNSSRSAAYHKQVSPGKIRAKPSVDILGQRFPHFRVAGSHRVAVNGLRRQFRHNIQHRLLDVFRSRYIGIAQAEVADIFFPHFRSPFPAIFKNRANRGFFGTQFIHFLRNHDNPPLKVKPAQSRLLYLDKNFTLHSIIARLPHPDLTNLCHPIVPARYSDAFFAWINKTTSPHDPLKAPTFRGELSP